MLNPEEWLDVFTKQELPPNSSGLVTYLGAISNLDDPDIFSTISYREMEITIFAAIGTIPPHMDSIPTCYTSTMAYMLFMSEPGLFSTYDDFKNKTSSRVLNIGDILHFDPHISHGMVTKDPNSITVFATIDIPDGLVQADLHYLAQQRLESILLKDKVFDLYWRNKYSD
jgi:hypothetical protein